METVHLKIQIAWGMTQTASWPRDSLTCSLWQAGVFCRTLLACPADNRINNCCTRWFRRPLPALKSCDSWSSHHVFFGATVGPRMEPEGPGGWLSCNGFWEEKELREQPRHTHTAMCDIDSERDTAVHPAQQPSPALWDHRAGGEGVGAAVDVLAQPVHVGAQQELMQRCKAVIPQLKTKNKRKDKRSRSRKRQHYWKFQTSPSMSWINALCSSGGRREWLLPPPR